MAGVTPTAAGMLVLAYLVGSIPSGYLLVRGALRTDVREHGSRNIGTINVIRVGGVALGIATLLADMGKALAMVLLAGAAGISDAWIAATGFVVLLGHAWSVWFFLKERRFSEGKCVASAMGLLIALAVRGAWPWVVVAVPWIVWIGGLVGPRLLSGRWSWISPATMAAVVSVPVTVACIDTAWPYRALSLALAILILVRHRNNIRRLVAGTEPRLGDRFGERGSG